jgi:plastocyanin
MPMTHTRCACCKKLVAFSLVLGTALLMHAQQLSDVTAQASQTPADRNGKEQARMQPPAAIWLTPLHASKTLAPVSGKSYTLLQKNKQFVPHLLIVPVGSIVHFPNADPFFHNVFSLFNGRRFDLGLYEAGSSKEITFGREGVSYIFCNIHPEMSAVVISLATPFYAVEDAQGRFRIPNVPPDEYILHVWVEGEDQAAPKMAARRVRISAQHTDLGLINLPAIPHAPASHENKFGQKYDAGDHAVY